MTRPHHDAPTQPDWVILGVSLPDGQVVVYASRDLTSAELIHEEEADIWSGFHPQRYLRPEWRIELTVGMRAYVAVHADTYEQALRNLFDGWSPTPEPLTPQLEGGPPAITTT